MIAGLHRAFKSAAEEIAKTAADPIDTQTLGAVSFAYSDNKEFGDVSTNIALVLSKPIKQPPRVLAQVISNALASTDFGSFVEGVSVAGPGFINFTLKPSVIQSVADEVVAKGGSFGKSDAGAEKKVNIEYVSANPTGPLTVAHGRQAAVGDALANILRAAGYQVTREYYLNDRGRQIDILGLSAFLRYLELFGRQVQFPEDGYKGAHMADIAAKAKDAFGGRYAECGADDRAAIKAFSDFAVAEIMEWFRKDLSDFGVSFDVWFSELSLADTIGRTLETLKKNGHAFESEGALWLASMRFGDDKDRVLIKSTGEYTYLSPDLAYHAEKYRRGFDLMVNLWGPDHHGYIPRLKAGIEALGFDSGKLRVLIIQLTTLYRGKEKVSMSTRAGSFISLREVMDEVGADAARFFFLNIKPDSHFDFDLELAKKKSVDNPVYYLQYAHARICSIFRKYESARGAFDAQAALAHKGLLSEAKERELLKLVDSFTREVESAALSLEPSRIIAYLMRLCGAFHSYYNEHQVIGAQEALTTARMLLCLCVRTALRNGLGLLGISAPQTM